MSNTQVSSYTCTRAALYVYDTGDVELAAEELLRLDRLVYDDTKGFSTEAYGALLQPGTTTLSLPSGVYHFKAHNDVDVRVVDVDAIDVVVPKATNNKDPWPDPPARPQLWFPVTAERWASHTAVFNGLGFDTAIASHTCTTAALYVYDDSRVELTTSELLRLDRLVASEAKGFSTERFGDLIPSGTVELLLPPGVYHFKAENKVTIRLGDAGTDVVTPKQGGTKGGWPDPPLRGPQQWFAVSTERWNTHVAAFGGAGVDSPVVSYTTSRAALYVYEPAHVEFAAGESVRLDQLVFSAAKGFSTQRYGGLLPAGVVELLLPAGVYHVKTENDVDVRVIDPGSVEVVIAPKTTNNKDPFPDPPVRAQPWFPVTPELWSTHTVAFNGFGFDTAAEATSYVGRAAALYVYEAGDVDLTTSETVRLDRLVYSGKGFSTERFGGLIGPGTTVLRLPAGVFHYRAESDVDVRIVGTGTVDVVAPNIDSDPKDPWPPQHAMAQQWFPVSTEVWATHTTAFVGKGYDSTVTRGAGARR